MLYELPRVEQYLPQRSDNLQAKAHRGRTSILILETEDWCWGYIQDYFGWRDVGSFWIYAPMTCWLPTAEGPQLPSKISRACSSLCKRGRSDKQGHEGLCLQLGQVGNQNPGAHCGVHLPLSLGSFQNYVNFQIQLWNLWWRNNSLPKMFYSLHAGEFGRKRSPWCCVIYTSMPVFFLSSIDAIASSSSSVLPELLWV